MDQGKIIFREKSYEFLHFADEFNAHPELWLRSISDFILEWFDTKSFVSTHTSGSTGIPKTIELPKQTMLESALKTIQYFNFKKGIQAFNCLPAKYIAGRMMLVRSMAGNWNLFIEEPSAAPTIPPGTDFTALTPPQLSRVISMKSSSGIVLVGGAPVSIGLESRILQAKSTKIYLTYGMTETASHVALRKMNGKDRSPYFTAMPGVKFETNEHQQLIIHADHVRSSPLTTNDVVDLLSDTAFYWKGRLDNVINSGGLKLYPEKIENELGKLISVPFFITAIEHNKWGEAPAIVMENDPKFCLDWNQTDLSKFEFPEKLIFVRKLIYTASGKIDRKLTLKEENIKKRQKLKR
ncbi:MAG TPA: O-succinylbenzoic acid--CoA ligase [Flavobacteriales bacterium]|jgi:O-succinylbenzoic acid--CoA ligase|nr:O-succinylbenzoic acid--CoA ligase [Flavobacteriales bacterium]